MVHQSSGSGDRCLPVGLWRAGETQKLSASGGEADGVRDKGLNICSSKCLLGFFFFPPVKLYKVSVFSSNDYGPFHRMGF